MASTILDHYGNPYASRRPARAADTHTGSRPYESVEMKDIGELVPSWDRKTIVSASRKLYLNEEVLKGAIEQKSMYAVGRAWLPRFTGTDKAFGDAATKWLSEEWYALCDIRGTQYDFTTTLYTTSNAIDRDGEGWELLTEDKTGYPRVQQIPAHRVGSSYGMSGGVIKQGPYRNATVKDGIAYNRLGQPVAASVMSDDMTAETWVSFRNLIHNFDPSWQEQGRGLPAFTASLNSLRDMMQSHEWERHALLMASAIGLIERNETGGPDMGDPGSVLTGDASDAECNSGVTVENFSGGMMKYFRANSGGGIEQMKNTRPGPEWESFHDRIIRAALAGVNWPYAMVWKASGQGTAERHEIAKAQRAVEDRQEILKKSARRKIGYAISKAMKLGILPESADWWKWEFTMPQKLTIDDGRVAKEMESAWKGGWMNHADILGAYGKTPEQHYEERAQEVYLRKQAAIRWSRDGITIEDREMAMLTPNDMSEEQMSAGKKEPVKPDENDSTDD